MPAAEKNLPQTYNTLWERCPGVAGILAFPGDVVDAPLLKQAGPQLVAVSVVGERCVCMRLRVCARGQKQQGRDI